MKRPLAVIGLTYLATSAAAVCFFPEVNFILCVMAAITAIAACFIVRENMRGILIVVCPVCIALAVIGCCQISANDLADSLGGQSCVISGEICDIPRRQYGRWRYIIETDSIGLPDMKQRIRVLLTSRNALEEAKEGDRILCEVQFLQSSPETGYNSSTSLRADGIQARCWCKPYSAHHVTQGGFRPRYIPLTIRRAVISAIRKALPHRASAMLCGMLLGDTEYMDSRTVEGFRATGIAHLLAVSGLHLTLLSLALAVMLRRLRVHPTIATCTVIGFILLFMAVTGFPPSVVRAGVMHILTRFGKIVLREADSLTSLSASALLMCLLNPWTAADIGLQLSVCATLGLLLAEGGIYKAAKQGTRQILIRLGKMPEGRRTRQFGKNLLHLLAGTVAASLSILPLTAIHFERISLISPVTNLLCSYAASFFLMLGLLATGLYCLPYIGWLLALPLRFAAAVLGAYLEVVARGLAGLPFSTLNTSYSYTPYLFLFLTLLLGCAFGMNRRMRHEAFAKRLRGYVLCEMALLLLAAMLSHQLFGGGAAIIVFDTGNGGMCVCAKNRTRAVFAEAGGNAYSLSTIRERLRNEGVMRVDAVALSDDSPARSANSERLLEQYSPDYLLADTAPFLHSRRSRTEITPFGGSVTLRSPALSLETFIDRQGGRWQRLVCDGTVALICPEKGNCALLPASWQSCDAVVVGKEILGISALSVGAVVTTASEKSADKLCNRLRSMGIRHVYSTSERGSITLLVKNGRLRIQTDEK